MKYFTSHTTDEIAATANIIHKTDSSRVTLWGPVTPNPQHSRLSKAARYVYGYPFYNMSHEKNLSRLQIFWESFYNNCRKMPKKSGQLWTVIFEKWAKIWKCVAAIAFRLDKKVGWANASSKHATIPQDGVSLTLLTQATAVNIAEEREVVLYLSEEIEDWVDADIDGWTTRHDKWPPPPVIILNTDQHKQPRIINLISMNILK